jgi:hypothetical protein
MSKCDNKEAAKLYLSRKKKHSTIKTKPETLFGE